MNSFKDKGTSWANLTKFVCLTLELSHAQHVIYSADYSPEDTDILLLCVSPATYSLCF